MGQYEKLLFALMSGAKGRNFQLSCRTTSL